ncbi:unnamed protein product [Arabis nemorensis]|uniref:PHD-type domain-containing protein n=1 Tax=Arabis nemorensis TaxID=586526 RepID=A0A565BM21_9BRAS|nr:unnamed protein product [Arabis nemorensis]
MMINIISILFWKGKDLDLCDAELEDREVEKVEEDGIMCAVCQSTDGDPLNPIVFCDGCDLMVHASCYGNPLVKAIPEGDWFCELCIGSKKNREKKLFSCCLCTTKGGAMKPTKDGRWAHITCSLFVPEVYFEDPEGREGICCGEIPKDLCIEYREGKKSGGIVVGFCNEHTKLWGRESGKYKIVARDEDRK